MIYIYQTGLENALSEYSKEGDMVDSDMIDEEFISRMRFTKNEKSVKNNGFKSRTTANEMQVKSKSPLI